MDIKQSVAQFSSMCRTHKNTQQVLSRSVLFSLGMASRPLSELGVMLDAALDTAFLDEPNSNPKNTLAVVVLHDGKLVAERYAPDIAPYTPLPGWSMAKSVTATLAGILVREGLLDVYEPGALAEWRGLSDARAAIAMDHLLRMTSGLEITEESSPYDINSRMLFLESDAAAFASEQDLAWDVGSHYEYMSGSSVLAMRRIQEIVGEGLQGSYDFVQKELFTPVKMSAAVLEPDASGTFIGSSFMLASPHDWARLGQLYLDRGVIGDLELIESSWISYVTSHTEQAGGVPYGAGVWISSNHAVEAQVNSGELPPDAINFDGFQGQFVFVIPSSGLVIVRLGATYAANPGIRDLVLGVLDAKLSGSTTAN